MRFIVDIPDRAEEDMIDLSLAIEGKMVYSGFNISLEQKILILMVRSMQRREGLGVPLDHGRYQTREDLANANLSAEMVTVRYVLPEQPRQRREFGTTCPICEGTGELGGNQCPKCNGSGR